MAWNVLHRFASIGICIRYFIIIWTHYTWKHVTRGSPATNRRFQCIQKVELNFCENTLEHNHYVSASSVSYVYLYLWYIYIYTNIVLHKLSPTHQLVFSIFHRKGLICLYIDNGIVFSFSCVLCRTSNFVTRDAFENVNRHIRWQHIPVYIYNSAHM